MPFKIPVAQYDVKNYVTASLQALGIAVSDVEAEAYVKLMHFSLIPKDMMLW